MNWKEEYIRMIGCVDPKALQIEAAQSLKNLNLPKKLYKYRPASDFAIDNLRTDTVWLNKPAEYNDPFEFMEFMDILRLKANIVSGMKEELVDAFTAEHRVPDAVRTQALVESDPLIFLANYAWTAQGQTPVDVNALLAATEKTLEHIIGGAHLNKIQMLQDKMKVCSFCESPEQLLMWGHYADYHKGFCIEYEIDQWPLNDIRRRILYPVIYQDHLFDYTDHHIQSTTGNFNVLYTLISGATKSTEWAYEKEWRFIFNIGDSFPVQNYPMNCQTNIYLGFRMTEEKKEEITAIASSKGLQVFQAKPSAKNYKLVFDQIN